MDDQANNQDPAAPRCARRPGLRERATSRRCEPEPGRPPAEHDGWDHQFSLQIENWSAACWEQTRRLRALLRGAGVALKAGDVKWTLAQAEVAGEAVQRIADRFDGSARPFIGGVTIILNTKSEPWWAPFWRWRNKKPASFRFGGYEDRGKICMRADNVNLRSLLHEMGHYYDEKHRLSRGYQKQLGQAGLALETNRFEDFANAFRDFVLCNLEAGVRRDYLARLHNKQIDGASPRGRQG
jgi:hypothetical protein